MNQVEKTALLKSARQAISSYFSEKSPEFPEKPEDMLGAFVTLHIDGNLRGCIGFPEPVMPLNKAIPELAIAAAFQDPRFPPLAHEELGRISIEISVLTEHELIEGPPEKYAEKVEIGRDGLIVRGMGNGLLLPQVATEQGWDAREFIENTCMKAGLPDQAYLEPDNKLYKFQADVFSES